MYAEDGQGAGAAPVPPSVGQALAVLGAALDYLSDPGVADLDAASLGGVLETLGGLSGKFAAVRAAILSRFDAARAHDEDGYGSSASWLAAKGRMTRRAASAQVRQMRQMRDHPELHQALADERISESWAEQIAEWTKRLPAEWRAETDRILLDAAVAGAGFEDLAVLAQAVYERWKQSQGPDDDPGDGGFDERYLKLGTTLDGVGRLTGNLTAECAESLQAILEALGKKAGPEDDRTEQQRFHDALQLACQLLIRADMVPDRAGADTRADVIIALRELMDLPGASQLQEAWLAALAGEHSHLAGKDAEVAACDALICPVVTGHPDLSVVDLMIDLVLAYLDDTPRSGSGTPRSGSGTPRSGTTRSDSSQDSGPDGTGGARDGNAESDALAGSADAGADGRHSRPRPAEGWRALQYAMARLAVDLVSGPGGIASVLRRGLLDEPYNSKPIVLDVGYSDTIPPAIRKAVRLRARGTCEWPGCRRRAAHCDLHHLVHKRDGGETSLANCVALCQFHHDVCIHRWGWRLVLHPDATTTAYGPKGQVIRSHAPPGGSGPPGSTGP